MPSSRPTFLEHRPPCGLPTPESTASFWHSQPSPLLMGHRSTRNLPETADVVIVGSGITGASAAYQLLRATNEQGPHPQVVMLEAREACWGATGRNGGHCQPLFFTHPNDPSAGQFELKNFETIRALIEANDIDCEFVVQPGVIATYSLRQAEEIRKSFAIIKDNAPELASMMRLVTDKDELNALRVPTSICAVKTSIAARLWPYKFVTRILEDLLTSTGLKGSFNLQTLTPVQRIHKQSQTRQVVVETDRGSITTKKVILATNAYTSHLIHSFADLIVPCRGQMSALVPFPSVSGKDRLKTSLGFSNDGVDDYLIQRSNERGAYLMFGGGRQKGPSMGVTDDSVVDRKVAEYLQTQLITVLNLPEGAGSKEKMGDECDSGTAQRNMTDLNNENSFERMHAKYMWTGIMGYSRDERPWVGPVPEAENVYMSAGYTGHGMPNAWLSGKTVALIVQKTLAGADETTAMEEASVETGLPHSFRTSKDRMKRAMELESVEVVDWMDVERGRHTQKLSSEVA